MNANDSKRNLQRVYSVKDIKIGSYGQLMFFRNDAEAIRSFLDACEPGKETMLSKHPSDFEIVYLGDFDLDTGVFYNIDALSVLCAGDSAHVK